MPETEPQRGIRSAVVIASAGRAELLGKQVDYLMPLLPSDCTLVLSVPNDDSLPASLPPEVVVRTGVSGASAQRNAGLDAVQAGVEVVYFFDDDALPHRDYFHAVTREFDRRPDAVAVTGRVLADGAGGTEVPLELAHQVLAQAETALVEAPSEVYALYGCNFAVRATALQSERFDDRLPLYSWLEDLDLSRRLARIGRIIRVPDAMCVHLGAASGGRTSHARFGYSQVANPVYLWRKHSIPMWRAALLIGKPGLANVAGALRGADVVARRRRLRGNVAALGDIVRGRVAPERITQMAHDPSSSRGRQ